MAKSTCTECGEKIHLNEGGFFCEHEREVEGFFGKETCPGSGYRPLNPGGSSIRALPAGLPTLGKDR